MTPTLYTLLAIPLTALCALLMYLSSSNQGMLARPLPAQPALIGSLVALIAALACWIVVWEGLVGGLFALAVWMTVSAALPFLFPRKAG